MSEPPYLLDVNVVLALMWNAHQHHFRVREWVANLSDSTPLGINRIIELGVIRLLTSPRVMGPDVLDSTHVYPMFDQLAQALRISFVAEPGGLDRAMRTVTLRLQRGAIVDADAYLVAFAETAHIKLVTLDKGLVRFRSDAVLLLTEAGVSGEALPG
ncbi:MAG: hypothetical protein SFX74_05725 [Fimbriimonadaceae bacterium]|nr:hypothetical protein [Fimbriimonadaceae bacterium]